MSAYMIDREHVRYLIEAATSRRILGRGNSPLRWFHGGDWREIGNNPATVGQMLWNENVASVSYRYDEPASDNLPGPIGETYRYPVHHRLVIEFDVAQVLKACHCYTYQSCEHPGWEASAAKAFIDALESRACRSIVGYDDAEWGAPRECYAATPAARVTRAAICSTDSEDHPF